MATAIGTIYGGTRRDQSPEMRARGILLTVFCQLTALDPAPCPADHGAMNRDQRLYDLITLMRDGRLHTAAELAQAVGVSTRTIWRDMAVMAQTGLPVEGERGVGYILRAALVLPPTMLTPEEVEALAEGLRHVGAREDAKGRAARSLLVKVATLLPQAGIET